MSGPILFTTERELRCRAAIARDLAATTANHAERQRHLDAAATYANGVPGSRYEMQLIRN